VVAIGYALPATDNLVQKYFHDIDPNFVPKTPPPDAILANSVFHPGNRTFIPGTITDELDLPAGRIFSFKGSLYHGHSGSPVLAIDNGVAKVGAVVYGVTHPKMNFNTVIATNVGPGAAVFAQYAA